MKNLRSATPSQDFLKIPKNYENSGIFLPQLFLGLISTANFSARKIQVKKITFWPFWGLKSEPSKKSIFSVHKKRTVSGFAQNWLKRTIWHLSGLYLGQKGLFWDPSKIALFCLTGGQEAKISVFLCSQLGPLIIDLGALQGRGEPSQKFQLKRTSQKRFRAHQKWRFWQKSENRPKSTFCHFQ